MRTRAFLLVLVAAAGCEKKVAATGAGSKVPGAPVETQPPNATGQKPAFAGQTRAPYKTANVAFKTETLASKLEHPWAVAFLPGGDMLITERPGRMRILSEDGTLSKPIAGLPKVDARGQGGLLDVAVDPAYDQNGFIYWSYAEPRGGDTNGTAVARGRLVRSASPHVDDVDIIFRQQPAMKSVNHFGSRLVFARDHTLFITLGERFITEGRMQAQKLDSDLGKIVRINTDGSIPEDNPFFGKKDVRPEIWSYGHRNIQAAALNPATGELWVVEHGTRGGDEVNRIEKGHDYGWPTIAYGIEYQGGPITGGITQHPGMDQPLYYWDPVIAPSGMAFYTGKLFPAWNGSLFVGGLAGKHVARLTLNGTRVTGEERLLAGKARIRDVREGPDGALYLLTDEENGELLRLVPAEGTRATARR
ncbi:MAG: PQQ-dependent sugar dehydrogenase [Kofleriaceae bacterium]|nr:PQQ-dependent sugar dehydrogenase [Kofleriaceae bacterium]